MPFPAIYDFSAESDIKETLFANMQKVLSERQAAPSREALSFEELARSEVRQGKIAPPKAFNQPEAHKDFEKGK